MLPFVDVHQVDVEASPQRTWEGLLDWLEHGSGLPANSLFVRAIGCEQTGVIGKPGEVGSTVPGFRVSHSEPPVRLVLSGAHHFSEYELEFRVESRNGGSRLSGTTRAAFPGLQGRLYETAVIRSRAHVFFTRRMLGAVGRRAEDGKMSR
jgi:hypothetical protein